VPHPLLAVHHGKQASNPGDEPQCRRLFLEYDFARGTELGQYDQQRQPERGDEIVNEIGR
jgi:hypothetical protein